MLDKIVVFPTISTQLTNHDYENNNKFTFCWVWVKLMLNANINQLTYMRLPNNNFFFFVCATNQPKINKEHKFILSHILALIIA